ncbi:thiol-disulfide oxidoreductase DCC family protein [Pedobacter punctiformis]|uniref:DCC1-like thiol-disulfide oxidoreductase family protein n=1 Tax=Pedobacter punctiformis TaxID=3004097 RepID=A0ABT4LA72_9SPHI|nr:DCC1-like thiol-disulfide oxidoreductase family protein [Pedobacter sp. HCMS5-2]MCZ4244751.1 DCC1-like thiol-disulfide oxidoreductase family protein [Pedobacter sp. HCMS5-2]
MDQPVILFDGVCNLCNASVQFVIEHDSKQLFKFAALQSDYAREVLKPFKVNPEELNTTMLIENGKLYKRSSSALRVAKHLNGLWPMLYGFMIIPKFIRDWVYDIIANNRYKWWGKQESCWVPTPELKSRFYS